MQLISDHLIKEMDRKETDEDTESIDSKPRKSIMKFSDEPESIQEEELEARGFGNECALEKASCFQRLLFTWVFPIWRVKFCLLLDSKGNR